MSVTIQGDFSNAKALFERLKRFTEKTAQVGFPSEFNEPVEGADINLATLATYLEFGTAHIPERPFLRRTLAENSQKYTALLGQYIAQGLEPEQAYGLIAKIAQGDVQENIAKGDWVANAPSTIKRKGSSKPLIDTGHLRQSVKGVVK